MSSRKLTGLIAAGIADGATLVAGGLGRPAPLERGFFARPTIFSDVTPGMRIAREEIFGTVLSIMPYRDDAEALRLAAEREVDAGVHAAVAEVAVDETVDLVLGQQRLELAQVGAEVLGRDGGVDGRPGGDGDLTAVRVSVPRPSPSWPRRAPCPSPAAGPGRWSAPSPTARAPTPPAAPLTRPT